MIDLSESYKQLVNNYSQEIVRYKKQLFWTASARLIVFTIFLASLYLLFHSGNFYWGVASAVIIAGFLYLIRLSAHYTTQRQLNERLLFINQNELNILNGLPNQFYNGSNDESGDQYYTDLDIFGDNSLYHLLNRASTTSGKASLSTLLKNSYSSPKKIIEVQDAVKALSVQQQARQHICAEALAVRDIDDEKPLTKWVSEPGVILNNRYLQSASFILPALNFLALTYSIYIDQYYLLSLFVLISWFHVGSITKYVNAQSTKLGKKQEMLNAYASILHEWNKVDVKNSLHLQQLQQQTYEANVAILKLSQLVNLLDQRLNVFVNILLNSFLLYDIHCISRLEKWKADHQYQLPKWIDCVGEVECLVSLSTYAYNHPENVFPVINSDTVCIEATNLYHPLIAIDENVSNDLNIGRQNKILLITGSNMSGKTTYLRTVGINTLMAQCGLPVCAASFLFHPLKIYSSIRIADSLQERTSYFMAELKRLQQIILSIQNGEPGLILIDEILRGTNSDDKYYGSEEFVKKLVEYNTLTLFATHDLKLSELENQYPGVINNFCFESVLKDGELIFDYKILPGVAKNKNASFLMKKMGII